MFQSMNTILNRSPVRRLIGVGGLVVLLGLVWPTAVLAGPPAPPGAEKCAECHQEETEAWQDSAHAKAYGLDTETPGAACRDCHGKKYIFDHAEGAGMMQLDIDSSICEDCHTSTFAEWKNSSHAQNGVQCIGCHLSHSQEFRLTGETLCGSCHRDQLASFSHTIHDDTDVTCTNCHFSPAPTDEMVALVSSDISSDDIPAPTHDFTAVSTHNCLTCHDAMTVHETPCQTDIEYVTDAELQGKIDYISDLAAELKTAKQTNKWLQNMTLVSLGLGMGIGSILGIIFILVLGYITQGKVTK